MTTLKRDPPVDFLPPKTFVSYSWDDAAHKEWVKQLAIRLRRDGVDVTLDHWHSAPGDQIPAFMERAVRENDFVIAICTPRFKERSDGRGGGVGYEGDIMTAYAFTDGGKRKFIPVLRRGSWGETAPSWLLGRAMIDLSSDPYSESEYKELLRTLHGEREEAPPIGRRPDFGGKRESQVNTAPAPIGTLAGPTIPLRESSITRANGVFSVEGRLRRMFKKTSRLMGEKRLQFLSLIGISLCAMAAISFYAKRSDGDKLVERDHVAKRASGEIVVEHDSIAYSKAAELMAEALVKGNWSGARGRLLRKEVTWDAFVHSFEATFCVIQPADADPKYPEQRARVSFLKEQTNRHYVNGERIKVSGIVGEFDKHGIDIVAAAIIEK